MATRDEIREYVEKHVRMVRNADGVCLVQQTMITIYRADWPSWKQRLVGWLSAFTIAVARDWERDAG